MKKISLILVFSFAFLFINAQNSYKQKFKIANDLSESNQHDAALPLWIDLQEEKPAHANLNYKVGYSYLKSANDQNKALEYLERATQNTTDDYDVYSSREKQAPTEAYLYLAQTHHLYYDLEEAIVNYELFQSVATPIHYLYAESVHNLEQCRNAKNAILNPVSKNVKNIGGIINSDYPDFSPVISIDELSIYFTSRRLRKDSSNFGIYDEDGMLFEDIYVSNKYDGIWSEPEMLNINTDGHEAVVNISIDGQTLFIYKDDDADGNIYTSTKDGEEWSTPQKLGSDINPESYETHVHTLPNDKKLFFISDREGGLGGKDIYYCQKLPNGKWSLAQNAGDVLNTQYDEDGIFIHPDGKTMFFCSNGHNSIGGYDIFRTRLDDDGEWSEPVNMGYPINTTGDDVFFVTSTDGKRAYFSSFQDQGFGEKDIYIMEIEPEKESALTLLRGYMEIRGRKELPDDAQVIVTKLNSDEKSKIYRPRKRDGKFSAILEPGNEYLVIYSASKYKKQETLYIPTSSTYTEINRGVILEDVIWGDSVIVKPIPVPVIIDSTETIIEIEPKAIEVGEYSYTQFFSYNKNRINQSHPEYIKMINGATLIAKVNRRIVISIKSSASTVPSRTFKTNHALAYKRAVDAKRHITNALISKGVNPSIIVFKEVDSSVNGPAYNEDYQNISIYEKHQYVTIYIK